MSLGAQPPAAPLPGGEVVEILADSQQKSGSVFLLRGHVEVRYRGVRLTADEITYDEGTRVVEARGQVVFERDDDRVEAAEGRYNLRTGEGLFQQVSGTVGVPPRRNDNYLVTTNPFYFEAQSAERRSDGSYLIRKGWVTK